jgi:hypothetical protein
MFSTGATGLEPATSGVTGRSWCFRAERDWAGISGMSRTFRRLSCGVTRRLAGDSANLPRDMCGMERCLRWRRAGCLRYAPHADPVPRLASPGGPHAVTLVRPVQRPEGRGSQEHRLVRLAHGRRAPQCLWRLTRPVCEKGFPRDLNRLQVGAVSPDDEDPGGGEQHVPAALRPDRTLTKPSREEMPARAVGTG